MKLRRLMILIAVVAVLLTPVATCEVTRIDYWSLAPTHNAGYMVKWRRVVLQVSASGHHVSFQVFWF